MKRFLLLFCVLFLFLGGCAVPHVSSPTEGETDGVVSPDEYRLTLDGRRFSFDGDPSLLRAEEDRLMILGGGSYRISGTLTEGSLRVCAPPDQVVHLILDGASLSSTYHPPLLLEEAACVILETEEGSVNRLTDAKRASSTEAPAGCLVAYCDLILRGKGALYVSGRQDAALVCFGDLRLSETRLSLSAPASGIWARDRFLMDSGALTVSTAKKGLVVSGGTASAGLLEVTGGRLTLSCSEKAIVASTQIHISGAEISLLAPTKYDAPRVDAP